VKREANVSAVSIPQNQTNPEKQYSINEETNLQTPEAPKQSVLEKLKSWIYENKTTTGVIIALAVVSIVAVIIAMRMNNKSKDWQKQVKQLTEENTQLKTDNAKHPAPAPAAESAVDTNQLKIQINQLSAENEQLKTDNEQIEPLKQELSKAKKDAEDALGQVNKLTEENTQLKQAKKEIEDQILTLKEDQEKAMKKPALSNSDFIAVDVESSNEKTQTDIKNSLATSDASSFETEADAGITNEVPLEVFTNAIMQPLQQELAKYERETADKQTRLEYRFLVLQNKLSGLTPQKGELTLQRRSSLPIIPLSVLNTLSSFPFN
jgi:hypothetical protein